MNIVNTSVAIMPLVDSSNCIISRQVIIKVRHMVMTL